MKIRGYHPACLALPAPTEEDIAAVAASIAAVGQIDPVDVVDGLVLDGRTRILACQRLGRTPTYREVQVFTAVDAVAFVVARHIARRHLSQGQKAALAERLAATAKISKEKAAELFGVSLPVVKKARTLRNRAPALADKVAAGEMTLNAADKAMRGKAAPEVKPVAFPPQPKTADELLEHILYYNDIFDTPGERSMALRQLAAETKRLLRGTT